MKKVLLAFLVFFIVVTLATVFNIRIRRRVVFLSLLFASIFSMVSLVLIALVKEWKRFLKSEEKRIEKEIQEEEIIKRLREGRAALSGDDRYTSPDP